VEELLAERGLDISYETVRSWVLKFGPAIAAITRRMLTAALETGDLPAALAVLDQDIVVHSPILATTSNEVSGHAIVVKILRTAFACYGMPRNVREF
jgi:hypothetical protein